MNIKNTLGRPMEIETGIKGLKALWLTGPEAITFIHRIAEFRLTSFREFPYLYDGTITDEETYLKTYFESCKAKLFLAFHGNDLVAFSSCLPLADEGDYMQKPFQEPSA